MFQLFFLPLVMLFVWKTIIHQSPELQGKEETITLYYLLLPLISLFTSAWGGVFLAEKIRSGKLNMFLVKPITPFIFDFANNIAEKGVKIVFLIPMVIIGIMLFPANFSLPIPTFIIVLTALLMSSMANFLIETIIGLSGFWSEEVTSFDNFVDIAKFTLGGRVIPLFLFPAGIRVLANILPFRYLAVFPLEIMTGAVNNKEIVIGLTIQSLWLVVFIIFAKVLWKKGLRKYSATGG